MIEVDIIMDEQFVTYWLGWIVFIIIVFFMDKTRIRLFFLIFSLLLIVVYPLYINIGFFSVSLAHLILLGYSLMFFVYNYGRSKHVFVTFCLILGYTSILIWHIVTPVLFFLSPYLIVSLVIVIFVQMITKDLKRQLSIALFSASFGHALYNYLLFEYGLTNRWENQIVLVVNIIILMLVCIQVMKT